MAYLYPRAPRQELSVLQVTLYAAGVPSSFQLHHLRARQFKSPPKVTSGAMTSWCLVPITHAGVLWRVYITVDNTGHPEQRYLGKLVLFGFFRTADLGQQYRTK